MGNNKNIIEISQLKKKLVISLVNLWSASFYLLVFKYDFFVFLAYNKNKICKGRIVMNVSIIRTVVL